MSIGKIDGKKIDANNDGKVSKEEYAKFFKDSASKWSDKVASASKFETIHLPTDGAATSSLGDVLSPSEVGVTTEEKIELVKKQIIEASNDQKKVENLKKELAGLENILKQQNTISDKKLDVKTLEMKAQEANDQASGKSKSSGGEKFKSSSLNAASAQSKMLEMKSTKSTSFETPDGWGADESVGGKTLSLSAEDLYQSSLTKELSLGDTYDDILSNQKKGKELMRLFYYYSRLAASGDMGAIYQFMKFINYVISKDKAKQTIEMGNKLIALQEMSRQWTNKLVDLDTSADDTSSSNELMKTMTLVKSETDAIATSQKLLSQMMEEFGQVVETLTNTTKSAFMAYKNIMNAVSQMH